MRRNRNLTLRLVPPRSDHLHHRTEEEPTDEVDLSGEDRNENQNQQITIFYNGRVSVSDVTDLQARAIIKLASEEMEERTPKSSPCSPLMASPSPGGLSMKRSLQRFLQKRKHRIQTTSPYHH